MTPPVLGRTLLPRPRRVRSRNRGSRWTTGYPRTGETTVDGTEGSPGPILEEGRAPGVRDGVDPGPEDGRHGTLREGAVCAE